MAGKRAKDQRKDHVATRLTDLHRSAVEEYLTCWNKAEAYRRAGGKAKNPGHQAYRVFRLPHVKAYLDKLIEERKERLDIKAEDVLLRLWNEANDFENGTANSRVAALDKLGRHLRMWDAPEQNLNLNVTQIRRIIVMPDGEEADVDARYTNGQSLPPPAGSC